MSMARTLNAAVAFVRPRIFWVVHTLTFVFHGFVAGCPRYDFVFGPDSEGELIYNKIALPLVRSVVEGKPCHSSAKGPCMRACMCACTSTWVMDENCSDGR